MNRALTPLLTSKPPDRSRMTGAFHPSSLKFNPSTAPLSPQTPSLPVPDPASYATREKQIPFSYSFQSESNLFLSRVVKNRLIVEGEFQRFQWADSPVPAFWAKFQPRVVHAGRPRRDVRVDTSPGDGRRLDFQAVRDAIARLGWTVPERGSALLPVLDFRTLVVSGSPHTSLRAHSTRIRTCGACPSITTFHGAFNSNDCA